MQYDSLSYIKTLGYKVLKFQNFKVKKILRKLPQMRCKKGCTFMNDSTNFNSDKNYFC